MPGPVHATPQEGKTYLSISIILLHPFSTGTVHIKSADPLDTPSIDPNFLANEVDLDILVEGYKLARRITASEALRNDIVAELSPGPDVQTDAQLREYIKKTMGTTFHPLGTSAMLPREDGGVVDGNLKVYGTENLRIVRPEVALQGFVSDPFVRSMHPSYPLKFQPICRARSTLWLRR
jgi:choline dehydrogenase-like flavoprotein